MEKNLSKKWIHTLSKSRYEIISVLLLGFILRALFFIVSKKLPYFWNYSASLDVRYYIEYARSFQFPIYVNPLGVLFCLPFSLFSDASIIAKVFLIGLDLLNIYLIFSISKKNFEKGKPIIPALIYALSVPFIIYSNYPLPEIIVITFFLLFLLYNERKPLLGGIFLGLSFLGRGNLLIVIFLYILYLILRKKRFLPLLLGIIIIIFPFFLKNLIIEKRFVLTSSQGGINFFIGNNKASNGGFTPIIGFSSDMENLNQLKSHLFVKKGLHFLFYHPIKGFFLYLKKFYLSISEYSPPLNLNYYFIKDRLKFLFFLPGFAFIFSIFFIVLLNARKRHLKFYLLELFLVISILPFFLSMRYKLLLLIVPILFTSLFKVNKKNFLIFSLFFLLLHIIPKPFSYQYGFTGKFIQIAEIEYNNGKKNLAFQTIKRSKKYRKNRYNIGPELFEAMIYRENGDIYNYEMTMKEMVKMIQGKNNFSYKNSFLSEMNILKKTNPILFKQLLREHQKTRK